MVNVRVSSIGIVAMPANHAQRLVAEGCATVTDGNPMYVLDREFDDVALAVPGSYIELRTRPAR